MTWEDVRLWTPVIMSCLSLGWGIYLFRSQAHRREQEQLAQRVTEAEKALVTGHVRMSGIENRLDHVPDKDAIYQLQINVTEIRGSLNTMAEGFKALSSTSRRIEDFLMADAKSRANQ